MDVLVVQLARRARRLSERRHAWLQWAWSDAGVAARARRGGAAATPRARVGGGPAGTDGYVLYELLKVFRLERKKKKVCYALCILVVSKRVLYTLDKVTKFLTHAM